MLYLAVLLTIILYFINFGLPQVWSPNEAFYADATRRMLESSDFITPYYNGELRLNKPPMTYWLVAVGYYLLGVNEWGLRLMHVVMGILSALITALFAYEMTKNTKVALYSFLTLSLSLMIYANAHYASPEMPFTFFITLSLYLWYLGYKRNSNLLVFLAFLSSSLAMLVKGPAGFVIPAGVVFLYLLLTDPKELLRIFSLIALAMGLWWHAYGLMTKGKLFWEVFYRENLRRVYAGSDPFYQYFLDLLVSFLPYSFVFFPALLWIILKVRREYRFFLVWFAFVFVLFSLIKQKIPVYVMPAYPALGMITAGFLAELSWERLKAYASYFLSVLILLVSLLTIFYFNLSPWLLGFIPPVLYVLYKNPPLSPAYAMLAFLAIFNVGLIPEVEDYRPYRELGEYIKSLDPEGKLKTYQVGHFSHSLPFYAKRPIIRNRKPEGKAIVIYQKGSLQDCPPIKTFRLYTGSESRFFKFLMDARSGKRFEDFYVCIQSPEVMGMRQSP